MIGGLILVVVGIEAGPNGGAGPPDVVPIGLFSEMDATQPLPADWRSLSLAAAYRETHYDLVRHDGTVVVRARSDSSTSALGIKRRVDPATHPILEWRWKISDVIDGADVRAKSRFDAPVRVLVDFEYDDFDLASRLKIIAFRALGYDLFPKRSIMYVWANEMDVGDVAPTPYADWIKMVAVRKGSTKVGTWQTERRDVRADYRRIFGEEPPEITGIAFMTDTNSVGDTVTSYYGDIVFRAEGAGGGRVDTILNSSFAY